MGGRFTISGRTGCLAKGILAGVALLAALAVAGPVAATEGGGGAYPNGAEDFMSGAVPPPGNYFINYFNYYSADKLKTNTGATVDGFKLNVAADVLRFIHVTDKKILGGFWGVHAFIPLVYLDVKLDAPLTPGPMENSRASLGDIIIDPLILSWHGPNWHAATGVDIYLPTGNYDKSHLANVGRNYWTFEPIAAVTFLPGAGFDISAKLMYDINTKNSDSPAGKYLSGQELHVDYAVGKKMGDVTAGLAGYYYRQVTDDEANDVKIKSNRGQVAAFGPVVKYDYKNMSLSLKYLFETEVRNRPAGDNLWFKFIYAF
jgi:hypothetical protein